MSLKQIKRYHESSERPLLSKNLKDIDNEYKHSTTFRAMCLFSKAMKVLKMIGKPQSLQGMIAYYFDLFVFCVAFRQCWGHLGPVVVTSRREYTCPCEASVMTSQVFKIECSQESASASADSAMHPTFTQWRKWWCWCCFCCWPCGCVLL